MEGGAQEKKYVQYLQQRKEKRRAKQSYHGGRGNSIVGKTLNHRGKESRIKKEVGTFSYSKLRKQVLPLRSNKKHNDPCPLKRK